MSITQIITNSLTRFKTYVDTKVSTIKSTHADWNVTDTNSKSFIKNKPIAIKANGGNATSVNGLSFTKITPEAYEALSSFENKFYIVTK